MWGGEGLSVFLYTSSLNIPLCIFYIVIYSYTQTKQTRLNTPAYISFYINENKNTFESYTWNYQCHEKLRTRNQISSGPQVHMEGCDPPKEHDLLERGNRLQVFHKFNLL